MRRFKLDKSSLFLGLIVFIVTVAIFIMFTLLKSNPIDKALTDDEVIKLAILFESKEKLISTELVLYYPKNSRAAMIDIPSETGIIIKSMDRLDSIDVTYKSKSPTEYLNELKKFTATNVDWYIIFNESSLSSLIDLLDGVSLFLPKKISSKVDDKIIMLPSGFTVLDGKKAIDYILYKDNFMSDVDKVTKRQVVTQAVLRRIGEKSDFLTNKYVFEKFSQLIKSNLDQASLKRLLKELKTLDTDRIVFQRLTGYYRMADGKRLLFAHYDGDLMRDSIKQSLNALIHADSSVITDKIITLQILNGTSQRGLAQKTAEIFQNFGYEIASIDNAESTDIEKTIIIDRHSDKISAETIGKIINCINFQDEAVPSASPADFIIILGKDFNGRNCVN